MLDDDQLELATPEQQACDGAAAGRRSLRTDPGKPESRHLSDGTDLASPYVYKDRASKTLHFTIGEIQSRMLLDDPFALDLEYTRTMMGFLLFVPAPRRIVMIGLGGGSLAKFCHRHLPGARIDVVEIHPGVIALRDEFHVPRDDERFQVILGDGARYVGGHRDDCDVLMVDGFDNEGQPSRLCSSRFYDDARAMLTPGGVLVANLHRGHPRHESRIGRIRRSFGRDVLVVDAHDGSNQIVFARETACPSNADAGEPCAGLADAGSRQLRTAFRRIRAAQRDLHS